MANKQKPKLTPKQRLFIREYLIDLNATQAAIRAGYSKKTAYSIGQQNLKKVEIAAAIEQAFIERCKRTDITANRVLQEIARISFLDIRKMYNADGSFKPIHELDDDTAAAVSGIEVEQVWEGRGEDREQVGTIHKVKLSDKRGALEMLARHVKVCNNSLAITDADGKTLPPTKIEVVFVDSPAVTKDADSTTE